jgi:7,8-dihydropterin-6-yl-methyl-4-(beta-D-ribofuranosyl)aminobenzene 5'-phosphate synthase
MKIDGSQVDALIISHGHYDHIGGLLGFLEAYRPRMRKKLRLYTGGEDNFCNRFDHNQDGSFSVFGSPLDRQKLAALNIQPVQSEVPITVEGHAFTTGAVPRTSIEHVLPNTWVEYGVRNGRGCDTNAYMNHHFNDEELAGKPVPDQHWHEHATCFRIGERGFVVISSCGHAGVINTLRRAQDVSGIDKIYALVGGFHLAPGAGRLLGRGYGGTEEVQPRTCHANALQRSKLHRPGEKRDSGEARAVWYGQQLHIHSISVS